MNVVGGEGSSLSGTEGAARLPDDLYAERGGLMYLSEGIVDFDGHRYPMAGLVPAWSTMARKRLMLGHCELTARVDTPVVRRNETVRGHEFHWSVLEASLPPEDVAYDVVAASVPQEGYARANLLASYCHLHFGSNPALAPNFVAAAAR